MIYVDPLVGCVPNEKFKYKKSCHLFTDDETLDNLHEFAESIGLRRGWCQYRNMPHYDLTQKKRSEAVREGAVQVGHEKLVEVLDIWRVRKRIVTFS